MSLFRELQCPGWHYQHPTHALVCYEQRKKKCCQTWLKVLLQRGDELEKKNVVTSLPA
uniref:Uncharacterized protein n=1 Tax=Arundo donax TaxID=35708 RepID=A0A0A9II96_ARUDO